jgi:hypothetical protein
MDAAITNANDVRTKDHGGETDIAKCNSATDVYKLVDKLLHPPPRRTKRRRWSEKKS